MKVELRNAGVWMKRGQVAGEVVNARLIGDDGKVRLEGDWGVNESGGVFVRSRSKNARLSNFSRVGKKGFEFDGVYVRGLEGFLQGVKFEDRELQEECCSLVGAKAWKFGRENDKGNWKKAQKLYWKGEEMEREGEDYAALIEMFFDAVYKGEEVNRDKLLLSGDLVLAHSGSDAHDRKKDTILAHDEFIGNLHRVRDELMEELGVEVVWVEGEAPVVSEAPRPVAAPAARPKKADDKPKEVDGEEWDMGGGLVLVRRDGIWVPK